MTTRPDPLVDPREITEDRAKLLTMHAQYVGGYALTPEAAALQFSEGIATGQITDPAGYWDRILAEIMAAVSAKPPTDDQVAPVLVSPRKGSKLEQLHARYFELKAARDAAAEDFDAVAAEIKSELGNAIPEGATKAQLSSSVGRPLRLTYSESWRVDSTRLKREDPHTYVKWAKKSGSWSLTVGKG